MDPLRPVLPLVRTLPVDIKMERPAEATPTAVQQREVRPAGLRQEAPGGPQAQVQVAEAPRVAPQEPAPEEVVAAALLGAAAVVEVLQAVAPAVAVAVVVVVVVVAAVVCSFELA